MIFKRTPSRQLFAPLLLAVLLFDCLPASAKSAAATSGGKPNIIFILADDLGFHDVGFNGAKWVETPNLNELANTSVVFDSAYMYPLCSPSRAALITGKDSYRTQVYAVPVLETGDANKSIFSRGTVQKEHTFFSEPLNRAGYKLAHIGKWHVVGPYPEKEAGYPFDSIATQPVDGDTGWTAKHKTPEYQAYYPEQRGYHRNVGGSWWGDPARGYAAGYKSASGGYVAPFKNPFIDAKDTDDWLSDRLTDEAIRFISENKDQPFMINLNFYAPHRPSIPRSPQLLKKYQQKAEDPLTGKLASKRQEMAAFATMVESVDANVGRIVNFLDENKLRDNTVIIFTSDNGFHHTQTVDKTMRGNKGVIYEGGIKVPALINWPTQVKPGRVDTPIFVTDYFPTLLDIANEGDNYFGTLDGRSILPLAKGKTLPERPLFWHIAAATKQPALSAMRAGDWKLIQFLVSGEVELYNLTNDPREAENLYKAEPEIASAMLEKLELWRKHNHIPLPPASRLTF